MKTILLLGFITALVAARLHAAQPEMNAAIAALEKARHGEPIKHLGQAKRHLEEAAHNKHGERVAAIHQIDAALGAAHKHEHKRMEGLISRAIQDIREGEAGHASVAAQVSPTAALPNTIPPTVLPATGNLGLAERPGIPAVAGSPVPDPGHPRVNEVNARENNQERRIANGVADGVLTPQQAGNLQNAEQKIQSREAADMAAHDGHLTAGEQRQLNREENRVSGRILEDKTQNFEAMTPAQKAAFAQSHPELAERFNNASEAGATTKDPGHPRVNEVNGRENNQNERIANGEKNGSLTSQQANQLGKAEQGIKNREALDMAKHDGHLTKGEQQSLNRKENQVSHRIHQEKKSGKKKAGEKSAGEK